MWNANWNPLINVFMSFFRFFSMFSLFTPILIALKKKTLDKLLIPWKELWRWYLISNSKWYIDAKWTSQISPRGCDSCTWLDGILRKDNNRLRAITRSFELVGYEIEEVIETMASLLHAAWMIVELKSRML